MILTISRITELSSISLLLSIQLHIEYSVSEYSIVGDTFIRIKGTKIVGCNGRKNSREGDRTIPESLPCIIKPNDDTVPTVDFSDGVEDVEMTSHPGLSTDDSRMNACSEKGDNTPI